MAFLDATALESDPEGMALLEAIIGERRSRTPKQPAWLPTASDSPSPWGGRVQSGTAVPLRRSLSGFDGLRGFEVTASWQIFRQSWCSSTRGSEYDPHRPRPMHRQPSNDHCP